MVRDRNISACALIRIIIYWRPPGAWDNAQLIVQHWPGWTYFFILETFGIGLRLEEDHYTHTLRYLNFHLFLAKVIEIFCWCGMAGTACLGMTFPWLPGSVMEAQWLVELEVHYSPARIEKTWIHIHCYPFIFRFTGSFWENLCYVFPFKECSQIVSLTTPPPSDSWMMLSTIRVVPSSARKKQSQRSGVLEQNLCF